MARTVDARIPSPTVSLEALGFVLTEHVRAITLRDGATLLVDSTTGRPIHVMIPWKAYVATTGVPLFVSKATPPPDAPSPPRSKPKPSKRGPHGGPLNQAQADLLHELIAKYPLYDNKRIARTFIKHTKRTIQPSTVASHRKLVEAEQAGKPINRVKKYLEPKKRSEPRASINPSDFDGLVCKLAIANGAKRSIVRDSEQFADGQLGLAEAIKKFDPTRGKKFASFAYTYILGRIISGLRSRLGLPGSAKNRARLSRFSEVSSNAGDPASFLAVASDLGSDLETHEEIARHLSVLDPREQRFVERRIMAGMTLREVAELERPAVSPDTVGKVVNVAIEKMRAGARWKPSKLSR